MEGVREEEGKGRDRKGWEGRGSGEEGKGREGLAGDEGDGWSVTRAGGRGDGGWPSGEEAGGRGRRSGEKTKKKGRGTLAIWEVR